MGSSGYSGRVDLALLLMRLMLGAVFIFHGAQKLFGWFGGGGMDGFIAYVEKMNLPGGGAAGAWAAALAEFGGGILLVLGLWTPLVVLPLIGTMGVAIWKVHPNAFSIQKGGMEYALTLGVMLAALGLTGSGSYAIRLPGKRGD